METSRIKRCPCKTGVPNNHLTPSAMQGYREKDPCIDQEAGSYQTLTPSLGLPFESCKKYISVPSKLPVSGILFYQQNVNKDTNETVGQQIYLVALTFVV